MELVHHLGGDTGKEVQHDVGVNPMYPGHHPCNRLHRPPFAAANPQVSGEGLFGAGKLLFGLLYNLENLLGPLLENLSVWGQGYLPASPQEQRLAQFFL